MPLPAFYLSGLPVTDADRAQEQYTRLQELLGHYSSRVIIDGLLRSAAERCGVPLPPQEPAQIQMLIGELSLGLQLFCSARDLPKLKLGLRELCQEEGPL
jgi:hypothetical protein